MPPLGWLDYTNQRWANLGTLARSFDSTDWFT
jgi:hypothetical protein